MSKRNLNHLLATSLFVSMPVFADTANVSVYGVANISIDRIDTGTATNGTKGTSILKASSNASRIGFKGVEELGGGISAIWQIESLVALDNSGGTFATRNSYAGLSSKDYGTVLVGRNDTPYKVITRKLDNFGDTLGDNRSLFGTVKSKSSSTVTSFVTKQPDVIAYNSPSFSGFTASVAYVNLTETATKATDKKDDATSLAASYDDGSLYGALGYETHKLNTLGGTEKAWNAALGYKLDAYSLALAYEKTSDTLGTAGANKYGHAALYVTGRFEFDASAIKAAYTKANDLAGTANSGATHLSLGYDYRMSKRTTLYALYTQLANKSAANYDLGGAAWSSGLTTSIGAGSTLSAFSFGVKQVF